jgi:hypothetical protein
MDKVQKENSIFVLVKDSNGSILSQGQLLTINNVEFNNEIFSVIGIGGIIANEKRQGYGRKLMEAVKDYLYDLRIFCHPEFISGSLGIPKQVRNDSFCVSRI